MGIVLSLVMVPVLWFALAYAGLPRLWSHHEHKHGRPQGNIVAYTAQDIPGDPINLMVDGPQNAIECRMKQAGWLLAEPVSVVSALRIGTSVLLGRPYPDAPVSPLYVNDQLQTMAFEHEEGKSADRRHHVRFWQVSDGHWLASATFDKGVGLSLFTLQITHHIGPDVDRERDTVATIVGAGAGIALVPQPGLETKRARRNGGGDRYQTDGKVARITLGANDGQGCSKEHA